VEEADLAGDATRSSQFSCLALMLLPTPHMSKDLKYTGTATVDSVGFCV
jgi:hypothetical protein